MASSILNLCRYRVKSAVRGYTYYTKITPAPDPGTISPCRREPNNKHDQYAVAIYHDHNGAVLGYVPKEDSKLYSSLLELPPPVTLHCKTGEPFLTRKRGKQLHCEYVFESSEENIRIIRDKLELKEALERPLSRQHSDNIGKLIKEIKGNMKIRRIVLYGPPSVGKTSIKRLMTNLPPLPKEKEHSTPVLEPPMRLISTDRFTTVGKSQDCLKLVEDEEMIQMIAKELHERLPDLNKKENVSHEHKGGQKSTHRSILQESTLQPILPNSTHHEQILRESKSDKISATSSEDSNVQVENPGTVRKIGTDLEKLARLGSQHVDPLYSVNWTHVIDSGGQPEFADLLPLVFPSEKNLYFIVIPLDKDIHDQPPFQYRVDGENCIDSPRSLTLTYYEMIERMCKMAKLSNSSVKIIGTRLDCIDEEVLKKKEEELKDLKEKYADVIILNGNETAILALNAVETDASKREEYIQKLKEVALTSDSCWCIEETIPLSWIVLQLEMSRESSNGVISYADVKQIGDSLKIDETSLKRALAFFSDLALNFYFPNVIEDIVLEKIDVVTFNLSRLVTATYEISSNHPPKKDQLRFKQTGVFSKSLLSQLSLHLGNTFTKEHFIKILEHLKVIHCIDNDQYFFPGILPLAPATYSTDADSRCYHPHPLLIFWEDAPLPHAFFSAVIVALLRKEDISLCRAAKRNRYRNVMYLNHKNGVMLLVDCTYWMELYNCSPTNDFWNIRTIVWSACEEVLELLKLKSLTSNCLFGLPCSNDKCQQAARHPCTPISIATCQLFQCHKDEMDNWVESPKRLKWFPSSKDVDDVTDGDIKTTSLMRKRPSPLRDEDASRRKFSHIDKTSALDQTPDLQDACCRLKNKSAHWDDIGRELGVSRNEREALYNNPNHRYCLETVLLIWLQQEGEASTWNQLLTALKSLDYFDVVQDVINFINNK